MEGPKNIHTQAYVVQSKDAPFELHDVILDEIRPNEVLVEMKYTGICHTVSPMQIPDIIVINPWPGHRGSTWWYADRRLPRRPRSRRHGYRTMGWLCRKQYCRRG